METRLNFRTLMFVFVGLLCLPIVTHSQDAEKQKIIDVITGEVDAWYAKDRAKWIGAIAPTNDFLLTIASPQFYYKVDNFDSLVAPRENHFKTPPDPNVKRITKTDFRVSIKGTVAIVDLTFKGEDFSGPFTADQTSLMEKQGKTWKILRQTSVVKSAYDATEGNIEASLNTQGYQLVKLKRVDDAIKVLTLNTQLFPNAWNTWDSLADVYLKKGEKQIAIGFYKKSLELNPKNEYAKKLIEQMGKD